MAEWSKAVDLKSTPLRGHEFEPRRLRYFFSPLSFAPHSQDVLRHGRRGVGLWYRREAPRSSFTSRKSDQRHVTCHTVIPKRALVAGDVRRERRTGRRGGRAPRARADRGMCADESPTKLLPPPPLPPGPPKKVMRHAAPRTAAQTRSALAGDAPTRARGDDADAPSHLSLIHI